MALEQRSAPAAPLGWYVQAAGKVWGPYPPARIAAFVAEGRVAAETLTALHAEGPFVPAGRQARLQRLFGAADAPTAPTAPQTRVVEATGPVRSLLVWAALQSRREDRFEELLGAHGLFIRVGAGLWLVRARLSPAGLRNIMTRRLAAGDSLMVLDAPQDQAAWFNIDGETDRALRALWTPDGE